ncbi:MAG: hypothetical protein VYA78_00945 [Chloroflexota bacterium]|nr:hypothetical protein [Chloroflexota bacterium]
MNIQWQGRNYLFHPAGLMLISEICYQHHRWPVVHGFRLRWSEVTGIGIDSVRGKSTRHQASSDD